MGETLDTNSNNQIPENTDPSYTSQSDSKSNHSVKIIIVLLSLSVFIVLSGLVLYVNFRQSPQQTSQHTQENNLTKTSPTVTTTTDYKSVFSVTIPEGYQELKNFKSETHGYAILALKTPDELNFSDPYIFFKLLEKNPESPFESVAYDKSLCTKKAEVLLCGNSYNRFSENKSITVDGMRAIWQRIDGAPAGEKAIVYYIEKSPTEIIIVRSFAHDDTPAQAVDERIISIMEDLMSSFHLVN